MRSYTGFTVFDLETTGLSPAQNHRVIEIGIVRLDEDLEVLERWETLMNPERDIGRFDVHGITARDVADAPTFRELAADIWHRFENAIPVAHNLSFDRRFVLSELERVGIELEHFDGVCTLDLVRDLQLPTGGRKLIDVCKSLEISCGELHSAGEDARLCSEIFQRVKSIGQLSLDEFNGVTCPTLWAMPASPLGITRQCARERCRESPLPRLAARIAPQQVTDAIDESSLAEYMAVLDRVLEDRNIDSEEVDQLSLLAIDLRLSELHVKDIHESYLRCLVNQVLSDGVVTSDEHTDLERVAELLGIEMTEVDSWLAETPELATVPREDFTGQSVCFTGDTRCAVNGKKLDRSSSERLAYEAGLVPQRGVTKTLDILVVADPDSRSGKAKKARDYGTRIIAERAFWYKLGVDVE